MHHGLVEKENAAIATDADIEESVDEENDRACRASAHASAANYLGGANNAVDRLRQRQ